MRSHDRQVENFQFLALKSHRGSWLICTAARRSILFRFDWTRSQMTTVGRGWRFLLIQSSGNARNEKWTRAEGVVVVCLPPPFKRRLKLWLDYVDKLVVKYLLDILVIYIRAGGRARQAGQKKSCLLGPVLIFFFYEIHFWCLAVALWPSPFARALVQQYQYVIW